MTGSPETAAGMQKDNNQMSAHRCSFLIIDISILKDVFLNFYYFDTHYHKIEKGAFHFEKNVQELARASALQIAIFL